MRGAGVGHVHFMFFVLISFAFGSQSEPSFQWNMGFTVNFSDCIPLYEEIYDKFHSEEYFLLATLCLIS